MRQSIFDQLLRISVNGTCLGAPKLSLPQRPCLATEEAPVFTLLTFFNLDPQLIRRMNEPPAGRSYCSSSGDFVMTEEKGFAESSFSPIGIVEGTSQVTGCQ